METEASLVCSYEMTSDGRPCGRPLYPHKGPHSRPDRCILHADFSLKSKLAKDFWHHFQQPRGNGFAQSEILDCSGFVFPDSTLELATETAGHRWLGEVDFRNARFLGDANFSHFTFRGYANFSGCAFRKGALFSHAVFEQNANFSRAVFEQNAHFLQCTFSRNVNFVDAHFRSPVHFKKAIFEGEVYFEGTDFAASVSFSRAEFRATGSQETGSAAIDFTRTKLRAGIALDHCTIQGNFAFRPEVLDTTAWASTRSRPEYDFQQTLFAGRFTANKVTFSGPVRMIGTRFEKTVDFGSCRFEREFSAGGSRFRQGAAFGSVTFQNTVDLTGSAFGPSKDEESTKAIVDFSRVRFETPKKVKFIQVNQGAVEGLRLRLHGTDVEGIRLEDVNWYRTKRFFRPSGRLTLQDELDLERPRSEAQDSELTPEMVAVTYRRLLRNFEDQNNVALAEDCHCGDMDMQRLDRSRPLSVRAVTQLYRWLSYYGSSYRLAFLVLLALMFAFGGLYGWSDLEPRRQESFRLAEAPNQAIASAANGLYHSVQVATFQRNTVFQTTTALPRLAEGVQRTVTAGQLALFLLALRRRFRR